MSRLRVIVMASLLPGLAQADCVYTGAKRAYLECIYNEVLANAAALLGFTSRVDAVEVDVGSLDTRASTLEGDVSGLGSAVSALASDMSTLGGRVDIAEGDIADLMAGQAAQDARLDVGEAAYTNLATSQQAIDDRVTAEEAATTDLYDLISGLAADIADLLNPVDFSALPTAGCSNGDTIVMRDGVWRCEAPAITLGMSQGLPGTSCQALYDEGIVNDGTYWIDPNGGSTSDAMPLYCLMSADGGGWTLVSKSNGADRNHYENGQVGLANLQSLDTASSGYVGDTVRLGLGKCYRIHIPSESATKFAYITNTFGLASYWAVGGGNASQPTVKWSNTFSTDPASYTTTGVDDGSSMGTPGPRGPGYAGGNWGHGSSNGTRMFNTGTGYGKSGLMFVKNCIP